MRKSRPLVKVKGKVYDANVWADYRNKVYRAQMLAAYFAQLRQAQQKQ